MTESRTETRIETTRAIAAPAADIFAILASPQGHVAIDSSGMLISADGDPVTAVGDGFVVHMDRESLNDYDLGLYDVTVRICTFEADTEIAWKIESTLQPPIGHVYGYSLRELSRDELPEGVEAPVTLATSYYDWSDIHPQWAEADIFPILSEGALRATLGILARTVAPGKTRPLLDPPAA